MPHPDDKIQLELTRQEAIQLAHWLDEFHQKTLMSYQEAGMVRQAIGRLARAAAPRDNTGKTPLEHAKDAAKPPNS